MPRKHTQRNDRHMRSKKSSYHGKRSKHNSSDTDSSLFEWEEEATLFSELMEEESPQTQNQQYDMLVETLQDPFLNQGKYLKKEIACTLVSGTNHVKAALQALDQHVDTAYGQGIIQFNNACKEFEATMATGQTRFRKVYEASKEKISILFDQLREEYAIRDQAWVDAMKAVDEIVARTSEQLKDTPASIERTIVKLEKKNEKNESHKGNDNDISSLAREFLKKMT